MSLSSDKMSPPSQEDQHSTEQKPRPLVIAHRGASGFAPENTLAAFRLADTLHADGVEFDVQLTADARVVVIHDARINRTTNGVGTVEKLTADQLYNLDAGGWFERRLATRPRLRAAIECVAGLAENGRLNYSGERVPSLDEALAMLAPSRLRHIYIELKCSPATKETLLKNVIAIVRDHGVEDRVTLFSFDHAVVKRAKEICGIRTAATLPMSRGKLIWTARSIIRAVENARADGAALHFGLVTRRVANALRERGLSLSVWTANSKLIMQRLVSCGADSIMTNYPNRLVDLLRTSSANSVAADEH